MRPHYFTSDQLWHESGAAQEFGEAWISMQRAIERLDTETEHMIRVFVISSPQPKKRPVFFSQREMDSGQIDRRHTRTGGKSFQFVENLLRLFALAIQSIR